MFVNKHFIYWTLSSIRKIYRLIFLPLVLLVIYFFTVRFFLGSSYIDAVIEPWGAAVLLMIINHVYIEHIFATPRDGLINALNTVIIALAVFNSSQLAHHNINFWILLAYSLIVFILGIIFLIIYENNKKLKNVAKLVSVLGRSKVIFPIVVIISFSNFDIFGEILTVNFEWNRLLPILIFYLVFLLLSSPSVIEFLGSLKLKFKPEDVGIVKANLWPNIVLAEFNANSNLKINDLVSVGQINLTDRRINQKDEDKLGLVLDFIGSQSEDNKVTARLYLINEPQRNLSEDKRGLIKISKECFKISNAKSLLGKISSERIKYIWRRRNDIVALVAPRSSINLLRGDIVRYQQLENAEIVSIINNYPDRPIRYQIIEAETCRELQEEQRDFGYTQMSVYQLGEWCKPRNDNDEEISNKFRSFFEFPWVPNVNALIFRWNKNIDEENIDETGVDLGGYYLLGKIPNTNLPIYLNIKDLVSHHTAILGVTGSGKSTMVFKLIDQIKDNDILVMCMDITGEYKNKISDFEELFDKETKGKWDEQISKILKSRGELQRRNITSEAQDKTERDCIVEINKLIKGRIEKLRTIGKVVLLEIPEISNSRFSLDFTQYLIQGILQYAKDVYEDNLSKKNKDKDGFRCCLVLEEAHTLVPENLGVGGDFGASKAVIDKVSQIALQGRKYNVGFILISQRTATVKKTVLNQCNTMIAFRAYDETSFNFLMSYFGEEYVKEISHLKNDGNSRYIIVSGKAVVADRPVIVEITK